MEDNFFDLMFQEILPALRAMMARKLLEHGFSQKEAASRLGLTQPAISQYKRKLRGNRTDFVESHPDLLQAVDSLARRIATGEITPKNANMEMLDICRELIGKI